MMEKIVSRIEECYSVRSRGIGEFACIKKNGMKFDICAYEAAGVGNFSTIRMSAMLGLMKMETVVFTPLECDAPLFSFDRILAMGNDTLLLELYDTQLEKQDTAELDEVKAKYAALPGHDLGKHWYDPLKLSPSLAKRGKKLENSYQKLTEEYIDAYLRLLKCAPACDIEKKRARTADYVSGLFENGGPSTDQFVKMIGREKAQELFGRFVFSSEA